MSAFEKSQYKYKKHLFSVDITLDKEKTALETIRQAFKQQEIALADGVRIAASEAPESYTLIENQTGKTYFILWVGETTLKVYDPQHTEYGVRDPFRRKVSDRRFQNILRYQWNMLADLDPRYWLTYPSAGGRAYLTEKPQETSIFTVIEIEDIEYPTLAASIELPYSVAPNNTVVLSGEHAYLTTEKHLHVINVSLPQRPSYLTSLEFPDEIGKVLASGDHLVIATPEKFHLVDVSQPLQPVIESTGYLPQQHGIKDLDVLDDHLYVMGENDHLYIFYAPRGHAQLVKAVELSPRWWLFSPKADRPNVQQIEASKLERLPSGISESLRSQRGFLQLRSSKNQKVRASPHCLVMEQIQNPMRSAQCDLLIYSAYTKGYDEQQKNDVRFKYMFGKDFPAGSGTLATELYYVGAEGLHHLKAKEENNPLNTKEGMTLTRGKPKIAYAVSAGEMQQITQYPPETIVLNDKQLELPVGPVTDFQILDGLLYVVNANGFFSIRSLITIKEYFQGDDAQFLSLTALQENRPISLAVGKGFAYVLATPENGK